MGGRGDRRRGGGDPVALGSRREVPERPSGARITSSGIDKVGFIIPQTATAKQGQGGARAHLAGDLRVTVGRIARRLRELYASAENDLSFTELSVLSRLTRIGASAPSALAETERVSPQAIGGVLAALHTRGLISRRADPTDGRRVIVDVTSAGRGAMCNRSQLVSTHLLRALDDELDTQEQEALAAVLPLMERLADRL